MKPTYDPAFASAVERRYLAELERRLAAGFTIDATDGPTLLELHQELMEHSIFRANRSAGGLKFRVLADRDELSERLLLTLKRRVGLG